MSATNPGNAGQYVDPANTDGFAVNIMLLIVGASYVIFMQTGFAMLETGLCRVKNATHVVMTNVCMFGIGMCFFYLFGFAWSFGGFTYPSFGMSESMGKPAIGKGTGIVLFTGGYALSDKGYDVAVMAFFLYQVAFMDTTATIPTGAMAERWKWWSFVVWGIFASSFYYPLFCSWTWGGGFLSQLGNSAGMAHGYVDFAGSGVVHATGGLAALIGAWFLGPRVGKFTSTGEPVAMPAHNIPLAALGCLILLFGWLLFNGASTFAATDLRFAVAATNTALAGGWGTVSAMTYIYLRTGTKDATMMLNGMLAGLVAITAPCAFVAPWAASVIGIVSGILVIEATWFFERKLKIDDPCGACAVHLCNGVWGAISVGLFADGTYGKEWNMTKSSLTDGKGVTGLFYSGKLGGAQLGCQLLSMAIMLAVNSILLFIFFKIHTKIGGGTIRTPDEWDLLGLDHHEKMGSSYPEFVTTEEFAKLSKLLLANGTNGTRMDGRGEFSDPSSHGGAAYLQGRATSPVLHGIGSSSQTGAIPASTEMDRLV